MKIGARISEIREACYDFQFLFGHFNNVHSLQRSLYPLLRKLRALPKSLTVIGIIRNKRL